MTDLQFFKKSGREAQGGSASDSTAIGSPVQSHTSVSPSNDLSRAVVSYWRKCVHIGVGRFRILGGGKV